jgi:phosphatidylglycerophosphate synthase
MYSYNQSIKSNVSDELINTYLLRPIAGVLVAVLYNTPVTPNQVTAASIVVGIIAAGVYLLGTPSAFLAAGLLVTFKDILDSADGQLARAKYKYSRTGRFLDSIGDFVVDTAVFTAIGWVLYQQERMLWMPVLAGLGLFGISLRVSYHVFYQTSFLHLQKKYTTNRVTEEVREGDMMNGGMELTLQRIFQFIYGCQDRLMVKIDRWSAHQSLLETNNTTDEFRRRWYVDKIALRISGFLGFGTELFLLMLCSVFNQLKLYLFLNLFLMNGVWLSCVLYRRIHLSKEIFNAPSDSCRR